MSGPAADGQDRWAQWVLHRQTAGDPALRARGASLHAAYRDGVLDRAGVGEGEVLLDVGAGAGLIGFGAVDRVGPTGQVIFSDVSEDLLAECRRRATAAGVLDRCRFVEAAADDLAGIEDGSVDVVTTRSVLIYVRPKATAFAEFFRVLRPGGRLSVFEPINRFAMTHDSGGSLFGLDLGPVAELAAKVRRAWTSQPPEQDPMLDFDERDLLRLATEAGFTALELDYRAELEVPTPLPTTDWDVLRRTAPNPLAATVEEVLADVLTDAERVRFESHVRAVLAAGTPARTTLATAFLRAVRP